MHAKFPEISTAHARKLGDALKLGLFGSGFRPDNRMTISHFSWGFPEGCPQSLNRCAHPLRISKGVSNPGLAAF